MYKVWRTPRGSWEHTEGVGETLRQALEGVALAEWDDEEFESRFRELLTGKYVYRGMDQPRFTLVRKPQEFTPFRIRAELTKEHTFTRTYEVARWFTDVECQPQTVESEAKERRGAAGFQLFSFAGTVKNQDMTALFGGVPIGGGNSKPDVGKEDTHTTSRDDDTLMLRFTDGGEHEPRPYEDTGIPGLILHWLPAA